MGPAATADFYRKLIARTPATRDQDHQRMVIWADPTVPGRAQAADAMAARGEPEDGPVVVPDDEEQAALDLAISHVKGGDLDAASRIATEVVNTFTDRGARRILLACTELPIALSTVLATGDPRFIDPTDVLARAVVRECCPLVR